ncbi:MAG: glycoside hydrolase family 88 protein [Treponema sp.]|jgi:unsaturated chondroitin disaccharide hydrolase|nr:glycoside hydrolase family 88 protein [Treponema sp.]
MTISEKEKKWAQEVWGKIVPKVSAECDRLGSKIAYAPVKGRYGDKGEEELSWWTNGFWPGLLWLLYQGTGDAKYRDAARGVEERLDQTLAEYEGLHHDVGFMWNSTAVLDYKFTGHAPSRVRALHAANLLAGRYNPRGRFIRAWNLDRVGWIIIDCLMNLSLLYWASDETKDPRFRYTAMEHADAALRHLLRPDGSCNHIGILDPDTGDLLESPGGQGYAPGSSWTRGQAWALYGFAISAFHTGEKRYLDAARQVAHYFISALYRYAALPGRSFVPPVDFRAPDEPELYDSSAGTIAACGLLLVAELSSGEEGKLYYDAALGILKATEEKFCDWDPSRDSIVQKGAVAYHAKPEELQIPLIYADYFFTEAVRRLLQPDLKLW